MVLSTYYRPMTELDPKLAIIALTVLIMAVLVNRFRRKALLPLGVAFVVALAWTTYFRYEYAGSNIFILNRINVYPLLLWTANLTILQLVSYQLPNRYRLFVATILYLVFLLAAEAVGYYLLNIRLQSQFTSLLNLGVIHAPTTMKIFYIFAGPAYLLLLDWVSQRRAANR